MKLNKITFGEALHQAMSQAMKLDKDVLTYGLGVGKTSNIFGTTKDLIKKFGKNRVFDTPSAESALTAMATGMSLIGARPVLIHQRLDFMIYSMDQFANWISVWSYKSAGKSKLPLTVRAIVGKGWGQGPQHGKSLHSWFAHLPGLSVVVPSSPYEAKGLLLSSIFSNFPTVFIETRSLYSMRENVPSEPYFLDPTKAFIRKKGRDITIVSFGSSVFEALEVANRLKNSGIYAEVVDLRSLNPIDYKTIIQSVKKTKRLAVIENGWPNNSIASEVISHCSERLTFKNKPIKFTWPNSNIPTSHNLEKDFYLDQDKIYKSIKKLVGK